jgi:hypothetical protein
MKKIVTLLFTSLIVLLMFMGQGNQVQAAGNVIYLGLAPDIVHDDNCGCDELKPLTGKERNKIVSELLKTETFKKERKLLQLSGYKWNGAGAIEVIKADGSPILVGVPFTTEEGEIEFYAFAFIQ